MTLCSLKVDNLNLPDIILRKRYRELRPLEGT